MKGFGEDRPGTRRNSDGGIFHEEIWRRPEESFEILADQSKVSAGWADNLAVDPRITKEAIDIREVEIIGVF